MSSRVTALCRFVRATLCGIMVAGAARADESSYCRKVKARAAADSMLLMAPKLTAEALHFPASSLARSSGGRAAAVELRAGLSYSPVDALRGRLLLGVGEADCLHHEAASEVDELLLQAMDRSELAAHRAEAEQLAARRSDWEGTLQEAEGALAAGLLTLAELHELRHSTRKLEQRWLEAQLAAARLEVRLGAQTVPRHVLGRRYLERAGELERAVSRLRALDAWSFQLTGGLAALSDEQRAQWFGFAELSYNLGALFRGGRESTYLQARADELRQAPYERARQLAAFRQRVGVEYSSAQRELASTEAELTRLQRALGAFSGVDATSAARGRTLVLIDQISAEADAAFLRAKLRGLRLLLETIHDS